MSVINNILIATFVVAIVICIVVFLRLIMKKRERQAILIEIEECVEGAFEEISSLFRYSHYITESERARLANKYNSLYGKVCNVLRSKELNKSDKKDCIVRFAKAMSDTVGFKKANNKHFIDSQLESYKDYFDTILSYPLDQQQREAVVSLEDNVLVISSAGSGKTMTTVAKVRYLIDIQKVAPEKILLITFTRKAAQSLSERLGEKSLKCRTFHKLALEIIAESTGEKPTIVPSDFSEQVYHKLFKERPEFRYAVVDYIIRSRYKMKDQFEYSTMNEYIEARKKQSIQALFCDMDGYPVFCRSDEESKICDFLGSRGIKFRYEESYEYNVSDENHRQYHPDFSIYFEDSSGMVKRIYLEHFAVNEQGHCPRWFSPVEEENYLYGINWKRSLHNEKGTVLLETSSAGFHRGDVFEMLTKDLIRSGVTFNHVEYSDNFSRELVKQEENILDMLTSFNFLLKSGNKKLDEIQREAHGEERITLKELIVPFVKTYYNQEHKDNEIDFTDAIIEATLLCKNGCRPDYDYILVDEFQDISIDRYKFLQSLRREDLKTKLFCVGDDWQSIYRFAGSDMALFKHFSDYFGYTKTCLMETTYRFGEPAVSQSSAFILANPGQAEKTVHPFASGLYTKLDFVGYPSREAVYEVIKGIIDYIPEDKSIMFLGRYSFDVNVFSDTDWLVKTTREKIYVQCGSRKIPFMTVHQSKGLESDYVILLNCNEGTLGFPANIADDAILKYVLSEPDQFQYSEERRIFYVAITRAKYHTFVLYDTRKPSTFVLEMTKRPIVKHSSEQIDDKDLCPRCRCGKVMVAKRGIASNGNPYNVLICSNKKYGCEYQETVFANLNTKKKTSLRKKYNFKKYR